MLGVLAEIEGFDPASGLPVMLRASSLDDDRVCHLDGKLWWPALTALPTLAYDLFDGAFGSAISTPESTIAMSIEPWANLPRWMLADARIKLWTGSAGAPWAEWTQRFDGRLRQQPVVGDGIATARFGVDDSWLDKPLLTTYAGTTGIEGPAALKGSTKPLALGAPRYVDGVLIDPVNSVFQVSAYGAIQQIEAALERLARFGTSFGDFPNYAALVAADIPNGRWATCLSQGLVRFRAPPAGQISFLVRGDASGPDGWARKPGQLIRRIALLAGGAGKIDDASLNALDAARPFDLSVYLSAQTTARELIQSIAASVNAVAGVSWMGQLFVAPVGIGTPSIVYQADGSALPPVQLVEQREVAAPWWKLAIQAERTVKVHALGDVAFTAPLLDMGDYAAGTTYREGNIVQYQGSSWLYINPTPAAGNAPAAESAYWKVLAAKGEAGPGASNTAIVYIYRRSATAPALPTANATYTFATATLTGLNNGWSTTIPAPSGGQPLYVAVASAVNSTATDTIAPGEWTTPEILAQDGTSGATGINSATVYLYQRNNTGTAPALPTTNLTYTFATAVLSGALNGWSQTVPADSGGRFLHVTTATAAAAAATDNILSTEWAAVRTMAKDGSDGSDAINNVNRVRNSQFERDATGFGISVSGLTATVSPFTIEGGIKQYRASYTATAAGQRLNMYEHPAYAVAVKPGERLAVQCNIRANGPIDRTELQIWYRDAADANFGQETLQTLTGQRGYNTLMQGFAVVPAGAVRAFIHVSSYTNAAGTGINAIAQPMISSATASQTLFPPFTAGPVDGEDGSPGAPGTDGVTISASPPSIIVQADRDGGVYSGQFPATAQITVLDGNANVTESCTFSSSTGGGATGSVSNAAGTKGLVTATSLPSPNIAGYIMVTVTYGAKTLTLRMNVSKVRDGTNPSAAYPAVPVGLTTTAYPNPIPLDGGQTLTVWAVLDGINPTGGGTMSGSLQYSLDGGSSWNAMGGTSSGSAPFAVGEPASVHLNGTYTAPSGGATVTVRFIGSKTGAGNITISSRSYMQPK